jgi:hypothetical protein
MPSSHGHAAAALSPPEARPSPTQPARTGGGARMVTTKLCKADVMDRARLFGLSVVEIGKLQFLATRDGVTLSVYSGRRATAKALQFVKSLASTESAQT